MDTTEGAKEPEKNPNDFGKVVDTLHDKSKLASLRTYQGDMAEYIKEKNESVVSVALKEKERKEERAEKLEKNAREQSETSPQEKSSGLKVNLTMMLLSLALILSGGSLSYYIWLSLTTEQAVAPVPTGGEKIIPYNNSVAITGIKGADLGVELRKLPVSEGVSVVNLSNASGEAVKTSKDLIAFLDISLPPTLSRTLTEEYLLGVNSVDGRNYFFLILTFNDFGRAFSGLLEWEGDMMADLSFLGGPTKTFSYAAAPVASSTATTTTSVMIPKPDLTYRWRDLIIKNKDTRGYANDRGMSDMAYTFLDKNTVLITNSLSGIADLSQLFNSRSVVR